jgi:hypothetical protein
VSAAVPLMGSKTIFGTDKLPMFGPTLTDSRRIIGARPWRQAEMTVA